MKVRSSNHEWKLKRYLNLSTQPMNTILDITFRLHRSKLWRLSLLRTQFVRIKTNV